MTENARAQGDGHEIFVGDTVLVRGEVLRSVAGVGALLRFYSKTDEIQDWIREQDLRFVVSANEDLPPEPADGTWLLMYDDHGMSRIFHRDDAEGHSDDRRRHDQHWWDVVDQRWIDWPAAVQRGAARGTVRRMTVEPEEGP